MSEQGHTPERLWTDGGNSTHHYIRGDKYPLSVADIPRRAGSVDFSRELVRRWNAFPDLLAACEAIAEGRGAFSTDPLEHAGNVIEESIATARAAIAHARPAR